MQQPIEIHAENAAGTTAAGPRHLRVVTAGEPAQPLVTYVVLAPTHLAPEDLFSPQVLVRPQAPAGPLPAVPGAARLAAAGGPP
ncbi:hypothetical protein, partial [Streptomyces fuscigenes]|uniref:hypothetical protein n=1 Tax=Streptomyces fuscigenes TaxID=1528880 RepID=UPI001F4695D5